MRCGAVQRELSCVWMRCGAACEQGLRMQRSMRMHFLLSAPSLLSVSLLPNATLLLRSALRQKPLFAGQIIKIPFQLQKNFVFEMLRLINFSLFHLINW